MTTSPTPDAGADPLEVPGAGWRASGRGGFLHHVELWVPDLARAERSWGWLLTRLGAEPFQSWEHGRSWRSGGTYVVLEQSPALTGGRHDRRSPGLNHLAFWCDGDLDGLVADAPAFGWSLLFPDRHPFAGGPDHRAAYLEDADGYEVELVSSGATRNPPQPS
ncbi:VOC family protein [Modestobacter sp. VKM Ac-2986]|uniref:VOC family protein n=1 Tax=Modestobacter sp. VKM Ac-2986 TaxID=3004140 RepID=UPI0022AB8FDE|nr:VOC family protein [Modestobacter sp. VKM Ac-2986]MCZ2829455.1 VOC family protein [Modestobacter sp. VKM Ac-2986]